MNDWGASKTDAVLHDAVVDQFRFDAARARLEVIIWKRSENKHLLCWQLIVSGIKNTKSIEQAQTTIDGALAKSKRNSMGFRIDEFSCEKQPTSQHVKGYIVNLAIDYLAPITVECAKCTLQRVDSQLFTFER